MSWRRELAKLGALFRPPKPVNDLEEEIRSHLQMEEQDNLESGMQPDVARYAALRRFGNVSLVQERSREMWGWNWLETLVQDIRYGLRQLRHNPSFTIVAILTLALGIGANTLVFSVVNALLLRPLPVERPDQLEFVETKDGDSSHSFPNYKDLRDRNQTFAALVGYRISPMELGLSAGPARIWDYLATGNYFDALGVKPAMGRFFHREDDLHPGASPYAVLSYTCWQTRFEADPGIVGKTIRINRLPYNVLGVAPPDFHGTEIFYWPEVWVPMMMQAQIEVGNPWLDNRDTWNTWIIGRLKPGVSTAYAEANLNAIAVELVRQYPAENGGLRFKLARPGLVGDMIGGPAKAFTLGVLGLAAFVLLAACTNLASLLTARAADRQREIAIRLSIGASRGRVVRQVLTESLIVSLAGGGAGYGLATLLSEALSKWRAPMDIPVQFNVNPDLRVFFFAFSVSMLAGALFSSAPAWQASKTDANAILKGAQASWGRQRFALRDLLVVVQVALCFVLVSGCLVSLRGLQQAFNMRLGFEPRQVSVVAFDLGSAGYSKEQGLDFQRRALEAMEQLPGVRSAAYSNSLPLSIDQSHTAVYPVSNTAPRRSEGTNVTYYHVSPGFFRTMGTTLLAGRDFSWNDDSKSAPVAIVNVAFGKQVLHTGNPVGMEFRHGLIVEVIGVVEDGKYESLTESRRPVVYWPLLQSYNSTTTLIVRSSLPEYQIVREMRRAMGQLDPQLPVYGAGSLDQMLGFAFFPTRAAATALSAFGVLAVLLAATGIHGLVSYGSREARTRNRHPSGSRGSPIPYTPCSAWQNGVAARCRVGNRSRFGSGRRSGACKHCLRSFTSRSADARGRCVDLRNRSTARVLHSRPPGDEGRSHGGVAPRMTADRQRHELETTDRQTAWLVRAARARSRA